MRDGHAVGERAVRPCCADVTKVGRRGGRERGAGPGGLTEEGTAEQRPGPGVCACV